MDSTAKAALAQALVGFDLVCTYIPKGLSSIEDSRGVFKLSDLRMQFLEYKVLVQYKGRDILTSDFGVGYDNIPGFVEPKVWTVPIWGTMKWVYRHGKAPPGAAWGTGYGGLLVGEPFFPKIEDVIYKLIRDAEGVNYGLFEDWASEFGMDTDSRKAEATYRACLDIGLKLRYGLGEPKLAELRTAFEYY